MFRHLGHHQKNSGFVKKNYIYQEINAIISDQLIQGGNF